MMITGVLLDKCRGKHFYAQDEFKSFSKASTRESKTRSLECYDGLWTNTKSM